MHFQLILWLIAIPAIQNKPLHTPMELIQNDEGEGRVPEFEVIPKIRRVPHTIVTSPEELIYRQKQFEAAVKANPQAGATASERRSYLIKNWATTESQKKLKLLYKDAGIISNYKTELEKQFDFLESNNPTKYGMLPKIGRETLQKLQVNLSLLIGLRILRLSALNERGFQDRLIRLVFDKQELKEKVSNFPDELALEIYEKALIAFMDSFLEDLKKLLTEYNDKLRDPPLDVKEVYKPLLAWEYVFKMFDFLVQNEFISQEKYKSIFQDDKIMDEVVYFASEINQGPISDSFTKFTHDLHELTQTYTTPDMLFFSALGKEECNIISFMYLLDSIKSNALSLSFSTVEDKNILHYFSSERYSKLRHFHQQSKNSSLSSPDKNEKLGSGPSLIHLDYLTNQLEELIILIQNHPQMNSNNMCPLKEMMQISICYFLGFIETEMYPGIVKKLYHLLPFLNENTPELHGVALQEKSEDMIKLLFLSIRNEQLLEACYHYSTKYHKREAGFSSAGKARFSNFQKCLRKHDETIQQFMQVYNRIIARYPGDLYPFFSMIIQNFFENNILRNGRHNVKFFNSIQSKSMYYKSSK